MSKILKKQTSGDYLVTDIGITVPGNGQVTIDPASYNILERSDDTIAALANGTLTYNDGTTDLSLMDAIDHIKGYQQKSQTTEDGRFLVAENRIPAGYSIAVMGDSDNIAAGTFGGGDEFIFDSSNTVRYMQFLNHWYAIGAHATFEGCTIENYIDAKLIAPATQGLITATGDYTIAGGVMIVPVAPGTGGKSLDLTAKIGSSNVLQCTPVPAAGNVGWFDYDDVTNTLTRNMSQQGGYNLYTIDINLHSFSRKIWGIKDGNGIKDVHAPGLVGKLLYNCWKIKLEFKIRSGSLTTEKAAIEVIAGMRGNI